ncbi:hypothetical protein [Lacinutrix sp. 5H-3-7-4]|uniref:hypothetical protein n=1 Tax=Lacinutrix sp. (strain 5H-3-7-4) TaxID=983544 RepID=UPI00020A39C4|nr:hypothetical protein [Lacinutrix sp. 5H-3-7-4]AEH02092.1 hypothetical protein Lacal_2247 [Lacinutrix sp. 5H-3-7-4]
MHKVIITVTNTKKGFARLTSYPIRPHRIQYEVPLYIVTVAGKDKNDIPVSKEFKAIRFGIKRTETINAHVVGLQDSQSYTLKWDWITTMDENAWRVYDVFFVHRGPINALAGEFGSIGCIEICGHNEWKRFNNLIIELANCKNEEEVSAKKYAKIIYQTATRPALKIV